MKIENEKAIENLRDVSAYARVCGEDEYFHYCEFQSYIQSKIEKLEKEV